MELKEACSRLCNFWWNLCKQLLNVFSVHFKYLFTQFKMFLVFKRNLLHLQETSTCFSRRMEQDDSSSHSQVCHWVLAKIGRSHRRQLLLIRLLQRIVTKESLFWESEGLQVRHWEVLGFHHLIHGRAYPFIQLLQWLLHLMNVIKNLGYSKLLQALFLPWILFAKMIKYFVL